ncbi:MAG: hypothetical protein EHM81_00085 [Chloroflexi bacterium]|nr:MAG: hypothetical protein EHM81_00085 [Chloroflexota bacterium]
MTNSASSPVYSQVFTVPPEAIDGNGHVNIEIRTWVVNIRRVRLLRRNVAQVFPLLPDDRKVE